MHLKEALVEFKKSLDDFEKHWERMHKENPEHYPMELKGGNEGLWGEFIYDFYNGGSHE